MRYIECGVNNEFVSGAGQVLGAAGSHHDVALRITFGEMWDGLSMYVTFRDALGENPTIVQILPTDLVLGTERTYDVIVPAAPKARQGKAMVTVQGYTVVNGTQEANATNTATAYFIVLPSDYAVADDESIDATIAQQLQAEIDEISETITDARLAAQDAEAWAVGQIEGVDVPETDERYQNNSKYYAQRADESAAEAYSQASAAFESASSASGSATAAAGSAATATDRAAAAAGSATAAAGSAATATDRAAAAAGSATAAAQSATTAEGYKNTASQMAADAAGSASNAAGSATAAGTSETNAATSASTASGSASAAATSAATANQKALDAADSAEDSEAWAVGQRGGTDVGRDDATYHNNAKYWAAEAQHAAAGGVSSFNGRSGTVEPQQGDYTAAMVGAISTTAKGAANGVAELDASGRIPSTQLPSYVDDVLEYDTMAQFPAPGESGKIYVDKLTNRTYRWGGTEYTEISESLAIGETASTAYAGNKGKANADAITALSNAKADQTMLAPVEPTSTASQAYAVDAYLVYNGVLRKVTAAIAQGDTIVEGTNVTATTAGAEIATLSQKVTPAVLGYYPEGRELDASWAELAQDIRNGIFANIGIADYKTITVTGYGAIVCEVAGLDTYYRCAGSNGINSGIGHHADFISRDCFGNIASSLPSNTSNNGTASDRTVWRNRGDYSFLNDESDGFITKLPNDLQNVIIEKMFLLEQRYSSGGDVSSDTGFEWSSMGKLWLPHEIEVFGYQCWSEVGYGTGAARQYPIFAGGHHIIKASKNGSENKVNWRLANASRLSTVNGCFVDHRGNPAQVYSGGIAGGYVPLCFRIG